MKNTPRVDLEHYLDNTGNLDECKLLIPKLRPSEMFLEIASGSPELELRLDSTLPFDVARSFCYLPYRRCATPHSNGGSTYKDMLMIGQGRGESVMADTAVAFKILENEDGNLEGYE
eukprot:gene25875-11546_t